MKVMSLFDGISCGRLALDKAGVKYTHYAGSEIDKYALQISCRNYPDSGYLGDVEGWRDWPFYNIDLLLGGSPCQGFSYAGKQLAFDDPRSKLFFDFVNIKNYWKPRYFLLENVRMRQEYQDIITDHLGVPPIILNSSLVSAQQRTRIYWTNIPNVTIPEDRNIMLRDIVLEDTVPVALHNLYGGFKEKAVRVFTGKSPTIRTSSGGGHIPSFVKKDLIHSEKAIAYMNREVKGGRNHWDFAHHSDIRDDKSATVVANFFKGVPYNVFKDWDVIRKFHPVECERLQTIPDNWTEGVSNTQRYKMLGNAMTVDIIAHLFKGLK